jgi:hypothetical protein
MNTANQEAVGSYSCFRWAGRIGGILLFAMWLTFAIGEGVPNILKAPPGVLGQFAAVVVIFAGFATGWRHELAGGLASLAGLAAFYAINLVDTGVLPGPAFLLFAFPSVLLLASWRQHHGGHRCLCQAHHPQSS